MGAITAYNTGIIQYCYNYATLDNSYGEDMYAGGIIGFNNYNGNHYGVCDCVNFGNIDSCGITGGIVGYSYNRSIYNCTNNGNISSSICAGGIVGYMLNYSNIIDYSVNIKYNNFNYIYNKVDTIKDFDWSSICWSPELEKFCAINYSYKIAAISESGETWTQELLPYDTNWKSVCWSPTANGTGLFCAVAGVIGIEPNRSLVTICILSFVVAVASGF
jgi:hypothetical protein